jgi:hypothetical protein
MKVWGIRQVVLACLMVALSAGQVSSQKVVAAVLISQGHEDKFVCSFMPERFSKITRCRSPKFGHNNASTLP